MDKISTYVNRVLICFAGIFLVLMIVLTNTNILFRWVWVPIQGTFELMGFMGALVAALALGYTQQKRAHISVDVLVNTFSKKTQRMLSALNSAICMVFFSIVSWQIAEKAKVLRNSGEVTETLRIAYYPVTYGVSFGFAALSLVFLAAFIRILRANQEDKE